MNNFYVNKIADEHNNHEVHCEDCIFLPIPRNRIKIGRFNTSREAVIVAQGKYIRTDGCWFCCPKTLRNLAKDSENDALRSIEDGRKRYQKEEL